MNESQKRSSRLSFRAKTQHKSYYKNASQATCWQPKLILDSSQMSSARRCPNHSLTKASEQKTTQAYTKSISQLNALQLLQSLRSPQLALMTKLNMMIQKWLANYIKSLTMGLRVWQLARRQIPTIVVWFAMMTIVGKYAKPTNTTMRDLSVAQTPQWTALTLQIPHAVS